jgi:hypothetical protein
MYMGTFVTVLVCRTKAYIMCTALDASKEYYSIPECSLL